MDGPLLIRGVARGGSPPHNLAAHSVDPIQTRDADYASHTTSSPLEFKKTVYTSAYVLVKVR